MADNSTGVEFACLHYDPRTARLVAYPIHVNGSYMLTKPHVSQLVGLAVSPCKMDGKQDLFRETPAAFRTLNFNR